MPRWLRRLLKGLAYTIAFLVVLVLVMQLVPYGRDHDNPPVVKEPVWDSPRTRELAVRACFDCHSNETKWPGYASIAPLSWVIQRDVIDGRDTLNFSEWNREYALSHEAGTSTLRGEMPTRLYRMLHPESRLTHEETIELARGLHATMGVNREIIDR